MDASARPRLPHPDVAVPRTLLLGWVLAQVAGAAGTPGRAYNLTWKSTNFKTILEWEPKPINHVYTVQISSRFGDWKNKCFSTSGTECDVTDEIVQDIYQTYEARVLSHLPKNLNTELGGEPPSANSPKFLPYQDTTLGQPAIQSFEQVGTKLNVTVQDTHTLVRSNGTFLSMRDVFGEDLSYTLYYWQASSTGKKTARTNTNEFVIDVEKGKGYCFSVQAVVLSRKVNQKSPESNFECTSPENALREMLIVGAVVIMAVILIIALSVSLYKCRRSRRARSGKENSPLNMA